MSGNPHRAIRLHPSAAPDFHFFHRGGLWKGCGRLRISGWLRRRSPQQPPYFLRRRPRDQQGQWKTQPQQGNTVAPRFGQSFQISTAIDYYDVLVFLSTWFVLVAFAAPFPTRPPSGNLNTLHRSRRGLHAMTSQTLQAPSGCRVPSSLSRDPIDHECFQCGALDGVGCRDMSRDWEPYPMGIYHRTRILEARPEVRDADAA